MRGVTFRAVVEFIRRKLSEKEEDRAVALAESLIARAREMLLLACSTEDPSGDAALDAEQSPSYDMGRIVAIVGRLAAAFEESESKAMRPSNELLMSISDPLLLSPINITDGLPGRCPRAITVAKSPYHRQPTYQRGRA